jgi:hypothetical protein
MTAGAPSTSGPEGAAGTPDASASGGAPGDGEQGSAGSAAGQSSVPNSTCQILFPTKPTYYPWDTASPCPRAAAQSGAECDRSLVENRCVYGEPGLPDLLRVWNCVRYTTADGTETEESYWEQGDLLLCGRSGPNCPVDESKVVALDPGSGACGSSPTSCEVAFDLNAQRALDDTMGHLLAECRASVGFDGCGVDTMTVRFAAGCVKDFIVDPPALADCVRTALESTDYARLSCALGLSCSYVEVGNCPN